MFEKNLYIDNALVQSELDFGPLVIVKGNTKAKNIFVSGGEIFFRGNVEVEQTLVAGIYNHGMTEIDGIIEAELIMSFDHWFDYKTKNIHKGILLGIDNDSFPRYEPKDVLKGKYYDSYNECIEEKAILKALQTGQSLLKSATVQSPLDMRIEKFYKSKTKKLDLSCMDLKDIPKEILQIEGIVELDLSANYIEVLSEDIVKLKGLKKIRLYNCEFNSFPQVLLQIRSLESIDLGENEISVLPSDIIELTDLKELSLYNCAFTEFPEVLYSMGSLQNLNLSYQEDQSAFVIDKPLKSLKTLDISANFGVLIKVAQPKLEKLCLRNCSLHEIPSGILQSANLKSLDITLNRAISYFPVEIVQLKKLTSISFSITNINSESIMLLENLSKLKHILIEFDGREPDQIKDILLLTNWTDLCVEGDMEDMFLGKEILRRPNLRKWVILNRNVSGENINELRKMMNIEI